MIKTSVRDIDKGFKDLEKRLKKAPGAVDVGYWYGEFEEENGADLATVAKQNEYGAGRIPERSFMRSTYDENRDVIFKKYDSIFMRTEGMKAILQLGSMLTGMIKKKIKTAKSWATPNSPVTIAQKGSDSPLFDKGSLLNKIDFREVD